VQYVYSWQRRMVCDLEQNPPFKYFAQLLARRLLSRGIRPDTLEVGDATIACTILDLFDMRVPHGLVDILRERGQVPPVSGSGAAS
jgi:hypothetical protein